MATYVTRRDRPTHVQVIDAAEKFYHQRITADRQFIIQRSVTCLRDPLPHTWCPLAHEGKAFGSLFWCDCPCHSPAEGRAH